MASGYIMSVAGGYIMSGFCPVAGGYIMSGFCPVAGGYIMHKVLIGRRR